MVYRINLEVILEAIPHAKAAIIKLLQGNIIKKKEVYEIEAFQNSNIDYGGLLEDREEENQLQSQIVSTNSITFIYLYFNYNRDLNQVFKEMKTA